MLRVTSYPSGPRCWIIGQRIHHGAAGCLLVVLGARVNRPAWVAAGLMLVGHDSHDWRVWFKIGAQA